MVKNINTFAFALTLAAFASLSTAQSARAGLIDFNGFVHGEIITDQLKVSEGVSFTANNFTEPFGIAAVFDTQFGGMTPDPDLLGPPWALGNLAAEGTVLGNALILAGDDTLSAPGILADPNDEGDRPAGEITLTFESIQTSIGFDLIDVESITAELGAIEFYLDGVLLDSVGFDEFVMMGNEFFDATVAYGNNSANRIAPIGIGDLTLSQENADAAGFDQVVFSLGGSGAIDTINFIPEPATLSLLALGGVTLLRRRRAA